MIEMNDAPLSITQPFIQLRYTFGRGATVGFGTKDVSRACHFLADRHRIAHGDGVPDQQNIWQVWIDTGFSNNLLGERV